MKNILIIGSGGREHALALALTKSPLLSKLYCAPGNSGTATLGTNIPLKETDFDGLIEFVKKNNIDMTIVGPEAPLVAGIVDRFEEEGLAIVGPNAIAAQLEGSKTWAKDIMKKYQIPTARYETFLVYDEAIAYIKGRNTYPIVIKADGLAAGKGVTVAQNFKEAQTALNLCLNQNIFKFAEASVVIEDFLTGQEASILAFCDEDTVLPMLPAQDHKAVFDGDKGPNTGGMGAYCPAPIADATVQKKVLDTIFKPMLAAMKKEGAPFKGILFAGLMIDNGEPSVVEFNVRFGDPETQVVLPLLKTDLIEIFQAIIDKKLSEINLEWEESNSTVCVVMTSPGYPGQYETGIPLTITSATTDSIQIVHAGTGLNAQGQLVTKGGRVLGAVGKGNSLPDAIRLAYEGVSLVKYEGMYFRKDIAKKAII